jgi:hypothetical protein
VLQRIKSSGETTLLHVGPWLWRWASYGQPLTAAGRETGYELRLSWYQKAAPAASRSRRDGVARPPGADVPYAS